MKKILMAASVVIFIPAGVAIAQPVTKQHRHQYEQAYSTVAKKFGKRTPGCNLFKTCHIQAQDNDVMKSLGVLERMLTPAPQIHYSRIVSTPTYTHSYTHSYSSSSSGGGYSDVPGVPSGFASCVAMRESTDGAGSSNIYGIEGSGGQGSLAEQKAAFSQMYAARGSEPWSPYDGC